MDDLPKKSLGQHWLNDADSLQAICDAAEVASGDTVLEIGPGQGALTKVLLERGAKVTALEFDQDLIAGLRTAFPEAEIIQGDVRRFDFGTMPPGYKIVANIPYYLTANLLRILTDENTHKPAVAALLMQKEVAERVAAAPGQKAFITIAAEFYYQAALGREVPARLFTPPPKVDSQVLILRKRTQPLFDDADPAGFFRVVKAGFSQRRKTLLNCLSAGLQLDKSSARAICESVGIDPGRRAQTLSLEEWYNLYLSGQVPLK
jgi:16S rRNA (adenine1518-N6/adenine1519-N6)-dimethyltransferase